MYTTVNPCPAYAAIVARDRAHAAADAALDDYAAVKAARIAAARAIARDTMARRRNWAPIAPPAPRDGAALWLAAALDRAAR